MNVSPQTLAFQQQVAAMERYWADKEEARIIQRDARVERRKHSLRMLQEPDCQIDRQLLLGGLNPISEDNFAGNAWFVSPNMGGYGDYALQYLGNFVKNHTEKAVVDEIGMRCKDDSNFLAYPFPGHELDNQPSFQSDDFDFLHETMVSLEEYFGEEPEESPVWKSIEMAFHLLERMTVLRRFTDPRNPDTNHVPLPDGTNLESPELRISWVLHRAWIRALHYRSLYIGDEDYGEQKLFHVLSIAMALLNRECQMIDFAKRQNRPEFQHLLDVSSSLARALEELGEDLACETRPEPPLEPYSMEDTVTYNLQLDRFNLKFKRYFDPLSKKWQLWAHLLAHADEFEKRMDEDHVEDTMIEKRIVLYDEFYDMSNWMEGTHGVTYPDDLTQQDTAERKVYNILKRISEVNRCRRNFLLLRDWAKKRPWKQLYYIFDTTVGNYDYLGSAIDGFYEDIARIDNQDNPPAYNRQSPSNLANVWSSLFTIHPIGSAKPPQHLPVSKIFHHNCVICQEDFQPSETVALLFCDHVFHFTCIAQSWDAEMVHRILCPFCRLNAANWKLHEQCGIVPEVVDLWDNAETVGRVVAEGRPDLDTTDQSAYWVMENDRLQSSSTWPQEMGQPPRDVMIEMAVQRRRRRVRNMNKRNALVASGVTVAGLVPRSSPAVSPPPGSSISLVGMYNT